MKGFSYPGKSPAKQEGPIPKENIKLQKSEHPDTWVYKGSDMRERIIDLEDRAEFAREDAWSQREGSDKQKVHEKTAKNLQHEADIIRKRLQNSPAKQGAILTKKQKIKQTKKNKPKQQWEYSGILDVEKSEKELRKQRRKEEKLRKEGIKVVDEDKKSPAKQKPKKSTESAHGQLGDAEREYQFDLDRYEEMRGKKLDHIGKPFMRPPYKDTASGTRPYEKRQGYHGFKDFDSIIPQFQNKNKK